MAFWQGMDQAVLETEGFTAASGAEQAVPGMAVLFSLFGVIYLGMAFFQEHGWGTWEQLRSSSARPIEILTGKMLPSALVILTQTVVLFVAPAVTRSLIDYALRTPESSPAASIPPFWIG